MTGKTTKKFSPEMRPSGPDGAGARKDHSSRWATVVSIAAKIGCAAWTLNKWVKKVKVNGGTRAGGPSDVADLPGPADRSIHLSYSCSQKSSVDQMFGSGLG